MAKAYSVDWRKKVINAWLEKEGSQRQIGQRFKVSSSFIRDLVRQYKETGDIIPKKQGGDHEVARQRRDRRSKLKAKDLEVLKEIVIKQNDIYLREIQAYLLESRGIEVSLASLSNTLKKLKLNRKKKFNS